jgi:choline dehydrogenase-like flavoprotein
VVTATALRPTGEAAYRDGTGAFIPPERRIVRGAQLRGRHTVTVDACVIGAGAGGAPVAKELAEGGMSVALLEEGDWWEVDAMTARPREMVPQLYRDAGQIVTVGTPPIMLPLGSGIGGTTLVNSGTCFRTPAHVLERWRTELGLEAFDPQELDPYFRRVERELNVSRVPPALAGRNAEIVRRGAERLGWSHGYLYRNVRGCVGSGVCAYGCPTGAKQHTGVTYIPRAWAAGATTYTGARAIGIDASGGRVRAVHARTQGTGELTVRCQITVVACGALHTPGMLRRFGLRSPALGRHLSLHPAIPVIARMEEDVRMWEGVPQSLYVDELADAGIMLEGIAGPPDHLAGVVPRIGPEHRELMADAASLSMFGVMVCDDSRGTVSSLAGRPLVRYGMLAHDARRFKRGMQALLDIYWASGAREILLPVRGLPSLRNGDSIPLQRHPVPPAALSPMGFHPLGTARAGTDPELSVLDPELGVRGIGGLHVADASAIPTALGVNPQITIMALATRLAYRLLDRPAPRHEPHPEHIA